jgi:hypothetical protein
VAERPGDPIASLRPPISRRVRLPTRRDGLLSDNVLASTCAIFASVENNPIFLKSRKSPSGSWTARRSRGHARSRGILIRQGSSSPVARMKVAKVEIRTHTARGGYGLGGRLTFSQARSIFAFVPADPIFQRVLKVERLRDGHKERHCAQSRDDDPAGTSSRSLRLLGRGAGRHASNGHWAERLPMGPRKPFLRVSFRVEMAPYVATPRRGSPRVLRQRQFTVGEPPWQR